MTKLFMSIVVAMLTSFPGPVFSSPASRNGVLEIEHGGGCRKDSLPGQCCHRDSRTGTVHCH